MFHFDRWWDPAVEAQAENRAHRIGEIIGEKPALSADIVGGVATASLHRLGMPKLLHALSS